MICLPVPPSTNALYRNVSGSGRVKTAAYNDWLVEADAALYQQSKAVREQQKVEGEFYLSIKLPATCRMDTDNALKALCDYLVSRAITPDDSKCRKINIEKVEGVKDFCQVQIFPYAGQAA